MNFSIAGIALKDGKIFIAKRQNVGSMAERWEFPGGKVEIGESLEEAINREFQEEFHCDVVIRETIAKANFSNNNKKYEVFAFHIELPETFNLDLEEHTEYEWVSPCEIKNRNFVDSDLLLFSQIEKWLKSPHTFCTNALPQKDFRPYEKN